MFYNPDKFDVVIVILKFLSVLSSGLLAGESFYVSKTHMPGLLAMKKVDRALSRFRYLWPKGLQMVGYNYHKNSINIILMYIIALC